VKQLPKHEGPSVASHGHDAHSAYQAAIDEARRVERELPGIFRTLVEAISRQAEVGNEIRPRFSGPLQAAWRSFIAEATSVDAPDEIPSWVLREPVEDRPYPGFFRSDGTRG
jgi:hypothetical protein